MKILKSQKGFTLIELLAVIIILAVIMTVAIPNVINTLEKNKKDSFIKDAKRAINSCAYTIRIDKKYEYPDETSAVIFPLSRIKNLDIEESSYSTYYSLEDSFVAITKDRTSDAETYEYVYYVHLVSCTDELCENTEENSISKNVGINLESATMLDDGSRFDLVVKGDEVNVGLLRDTTGQYANLKTLLSTIRQRTNQVAISEIIVY